MSAYDQRHNDLTRPGSRSLCAAAACAVLIRELALILIDSTALKVTQA